MLGKEEAMFAHEIEAMAEEITARRNEEEASRYGDPSIVNDRDNEDEEENRCDEVVR